jgi:hypothetical protein
VAASALARAEDVDDVIRKGVELRRLGKDPEALAEFRRAAGIRRKPHAVAQLGLVEQALGLWIDAEADLTDARRADSDPWIQKNRRVLDEAVATIERHLGSITVWGTPEGAEVFLDGRPVGKLPMEKPARTLVGDLKLTVRAKGYLDLNRPIEIRPQDQAREHVELTPVPAVAATAPPPAASTSSPTVVVQTPPAGATGPAATSEASAPIYARWWFWTAVGVVAAGAVTTAVLLTRDKQTCQVTCTTWGN